MGRAQQILGFWFGDDPADLMTKAEQWWKKDPDLDREIQHNFEDDLTKAINGELNFWRDKPIDCLAYIILTDQFSRNIYRDTPQMFSQDALALAACLEGQEAGQDSKLTEVQRWFFYMPMMHSESLDLQRRSVAAYRRLAEEGSEDLKPSLENAYRFAVKHFEIVESFGRFPHRNAILGRDSNPAELAFLKQPGSSF